MGLIYVAWRNVFRNKRRTILNVIAVAIGMIMVIIGLGWMRGYQTGIFNAMINFETGHIQVLDKDYLAQERRLPLDLNVERASELRARLLTDPRIEEAAPRINFMMTLGFRGKSRTLLARAIDPVPESRVTILHTLIVSGNYLDKSPGVLIGRPLAEKYGLQAGDSVAVTAETKLSSAANAQENFEYMKVAGIFHYGYPAIDENVVYVDFASASGFLLMRDEATKLVLRVKPGDDPGAVLPDVQARLAGTPYQAYPWERFAQVVVSAVAADGSSFGFIFLIIYILIVIGIRNSMSMSVEERVSEVGTLRAIGMKKRTVMLMFLAESTFLAGLGIAASLVAGGAAAWVLQNVGFDFGSLMPADIPIPFGSRFTADFRAYDFLIAVLFGCLTAILSGLAPAQRAAKRVIARAMGAQAAK
ncbi:MAG: ABC transporter permease [Spirochaetales bacterium]|nr:ABC transporter permease [Spirochaetales bacterium]